VRAEKKAKMLYGGFYRVKNVLLNLNILKNFMNEYNEDRDGDDTSTYFHKTYFNTYIHVLMLFVERTRAQDSHFNNLPICFTNRVAIQLNNTNSADFKSGY
jgi:hypothetical protein